MAVHGRGYPAAVAVIRTWVVVLDRCLATIVLTAVALAALLLAVALLCPDE